MSTIATLEGLDIGGVPASEQRRRWGLTDGEIMAQLGAQIRAERAQQRGRVRGDVRRAFDEVYRNRGPHLVREFGLAGLGADPAVDAARPMTTHEKLSLVLGLAGLLVSIAGTVTIARRLRR